MSAAVRLVAIDDVARLLAPQAMSIAQELLPAGHRDRDMWRCGDVHNTPGQSLCVWIAGPKQGEWWDFGARQGGDLVHLVAAVRYRGSLKDGFAWARHRLGLDSNSPAVIHQQARDRAAAVAQHQAAERNAEAERMRRYARWLWLSGQEDVRGTPVDAYLRGRGIHLTEMCRQPRALRFHPEVPNSDSGRAWPAMLAAVTDQAGTHVATHRTYLEVLDDGRVRKAPIFVAGKQRAKTTVGTYAGACIRLWRGASGRSLREAPDGEPVDITEGIEDGLSVATVWPDRRVLVAISVSNMGSVALPPAVHTVRMWFQNDKTNAAMLAADRAERMHLEAGRAIEWQKVPRQFKDINEMLTAS